MFVETRGVELEVSISISVDLIFTVRIFNIVLVNGPTSSMAPRILPVPCIHLSLCTAPRASSERGVDVQGECCEASSRCGQWLCTVHPVTRDSIRCVTLTSAPDGTKQRVANRTNSVASTVPSRVTLSAHASSSEPMSRGALHVLPIANL